jgi:mannose-6-phosphate isomerase-like protein (cupin superfamily)
MHAIDYRAADTYAVGDVEVARWEQFALGDLLPFGAMWYEVAPGASSPVDCHPERELSLVVSGTALVHAGGESVEVAQGSAFVLEPDEDHTVRNLSDERPLVVFSVYWMACDDAPVSLAGQVAHA